MALARTDWIMPGDLFPEQAIGTGSLAQAAKPFATLSEARDDAERRQIERALQGNQRAHHRSGPDPGRFPHHLWEKMRRLGLAAEHALSCQEFRTFALQHVRISEHRPSKSMKLLMSDSLLQCK